MAMTELSFLEIAEIIRSCKKYGVETFEFAGLKLRFGSTTATKKKPPRAFTADPKEEAKRLPEMEARIRAEELEELKLRDPYEYEQLITQNELIHDRQADSGA